MSGAIDCPGFLVDLGHVEAPLALCSTHGDVQRATPAALELLHRLSILVTLPGRLPAELWVVLERAEAGKPVQWRPPGSSHLVLGCTRYPARDGFLLIMKEVSDVHAAQSRRFHRERLESTGRLVASIAHELRNPVACIVYSADLLAMYGRDIPPDTLAETMGEIVAASSRVQATVAGLLDYARLGPSISVPVALDQVLTRAQGFLRSVYREGSHQMRVELAPDARTVRGNTLSIEQIFVNLLLNAAEAATRTVTVRICSARVDAAPGSPRGSPAMVRVSVHDDGIGIAPELRETVFEPFFTTRDEGTGLGLNNALEAAESLGGRLTLEPSDVGACFVVYLPIGGCPAVTRVLIVDDDPGQLRMLAHLIAGRRGELSVVTANTGSQAIEALQSSEVDLVLTDLQMPEMSGFELLTWLVSNRPQIPIFTMTAYPDADSADRLDELGAIECFTKPLDIAAVLQRLSLALSEGVGGHVRNIGLPAFLQLVEMERKTCVLTISSDPHRGILHFDDGVLVDARTEQLRGEAAAIAIVAWPAPAITIRTSRGVKRRTIERPLGYLLLEGLRLQDEARRGPSPPPAPRPEPRECASFPLSPPATSDALAIVDARDASIQVATGDQTGLAAWAQLACAVYRAELAVVGELELHDAVDELVLTSARVWTIVRPVPGMPDTLVMLVFDPERSTLVMERLELDVLARRLWAWCHPELALEPLEQADTRPLATIGDGDDVDELAEWGE